MLYKTLWQKKGEEITDGYSGIFCNVPQDQRSQNHTRYHFDCLCKGGVISGSFFNWILSTQLVLIDWFLSGLEWILNLEFC